MVSCYIIWFDWIILLIYSFHFDTHDQLKQRFVCVSNRTISILFFFKYGIMQLVEENWHREHWYEEI